MGLVFQVPLKKGIKKRGRDIRKRLYGFDPLSLLTLWSRSYQKYIVGSYSVKSFALLGLFPYLIMYE